MRILPFEAIYPNLEKVPHTSDFFESVKFKYHEYAVEKRFCNTSKDAIYFYQIKNDENQTATGIIACTDIQDYIENYIKKHEKTILSNESLQANLLQTRQAAIKPVLLTYPANSAIKTLIMNHINSHEKYYMIKIGTEKHIFWQVTEPNIIEKVQKIFKEKITYTYLADGHHRSASFLALHNKLNNEKTKKMLCAFFAIEELRINAFNRLVKDLNGMSEDVFLDKLMPFFKIKVLKKGVLPYAKFEMTMYMAGKWFQLNWRKSELKGFAEGLVLLDVHLLNEKVLKPILGIKNIREDSRIQYMEGNQTIGAIEKRLEAFDTEGPNGPPVVFCLFPVEFDDLKLISDANGIMPPKSTFFEPRMKNGLLVYEI
jgi:uncharacterized protein (DUF1015 family)